VASGASDEQQTSWGSGAWQGNLLQDMPFFRFWMRFFVDTLLDEWFDKMFGDV
jgi:hypothetical protein